MKHNNLYAILTVCILYSGVVSGQGKDSVQEMRLFLEVCNAYKQLPLQLDLDMRRTSNLINSEEDTLQSHISVYMQNEGSYIAFGELEQVADDSLLLMVSNKSKRMALYRHPLSMVRQLKRYLGIQLRDSTVTQLTGRYAIKGNDLDNDTSTMVLNSRAVLYQSSVPKESIAVRYVAANRELLQVAQTIRDLVPVSKTVYEEYLQKPGFEGKVLSIADSSYFLVRERVSWFDYKKIGHRGDQRLPVRIGDRIEGDLTGQYSPVREYQDFELTRNF